MKRTYENILSLCKSQNAVLILVIIVVFTIASFFSSRFHSLDNVINLFHTVSLTGIMTIGMFLVIVTGNIDLSVACLFSLVTCLSAYMLRQNILNEITVLPFGILVGFLCGAANGLLVTKIKADSFIITLVTMFIFQGLALISVNGEIVNIGSRFLWLGKIQFGRIPLQILIFIFLTIVVSLIMSFSKFGRNLYAVGGNPEASFVMGINVNLYKFMVYAINGVICSISAMLVLSKLSAANYNMALGYELEVITACAVGGVSLIGGKGNVFGGFLGILLIGLISNSLRLLSVPISFHQITIGLILLVAVILQSRRRSR